jgi:predicted ribosome quality control (RQC) complex YloA/Tae2 family protein
MPFDGFVMSAVRQELAEKILFGRIGKIYQPERHSVILKIKKGPENFQLLISAHPVTGRIHLTRENKDNPLQPPLFCMVLRKHLEGGRITAIEQKDLDRVLNFSIEAHDEIGQPAKKTLIVEIMGKHSNIILVNQKDNTILDGIKRYTHQVSRYREILPGRDYIPPPDQQKADPLGMDEEEFQNLLLSLPLTTKVTNGLVKTLAGFSPLLAEEVVWRAELPLQILIDHLGDYDLIRLWQAITEVLAPIKENMIQAHVALSAGKTRDFSFLPLLSLEKTRLVSFPSMSEALDFFYAQKEAGDLFSARQRELIKIVTGEKERVEKKLSLQKEKLKETENMENYRLWGELITANMYKLTKGMDEANLDDLYHLGSSLSVKLDPTLSPAENAQFYFKKYNKAKSSRILIEEQMEKNREELDYLLSVLTALEQAVELEDLDEIRSELVEASYLKEKSPVKKKSKEPVLQPLTFQSRDGYTILVGKNNKQNDLLTLKTAKKDDLWLHTKNIPGSHVIIKRKPGVEIPFSTIEEAARIAAYYSKARASSKVPVDYTLVNQVKKPNGAKPGMVIYYEQKTLFVTPAVPEISQD